MTDTRFINRVVKEADNLFESVRKDFLEYGKKLERLGVSYTKKRFQKIVKLLSQINQVSRKLEFSVLSEDENIILLKLRK